LYSRTLFLRISKPDQMGDSEKRVEEETVEVRLEDDK